MIKRLIKADSFDVLPLIAERSIALVLTDFPYGVTKCQWDNLPDLARFWDLAKPLLIPGAPVVSTATQPFTTTLINSNVGWFKYCWIWDKHIPRGFQNAKHRPMQQHPTQKPVSLFKYLIETYTKPGDVVLDPFAGRGTTALACEELGNRGYICIERDPEYYSRALAQLERRKAGVGFWSPSEGGGV